MLGKVIVEDAVFGFDKPIFRTSLRCRSGDILMIRGFNGSGKSCIAKTLVGEIPPLQNSIRVEGSIGYLPQTDIFLHSNFSPKQIFGLFDENIVSGKLKDLIRNNKSKRFRNMSGGTRRAITLTAVLSANKDVYILDEPFYGISSWIIPEISNMINTLSKKGKIFVIVEHLDIPSIKPTMTVKINDKHID